MSFINIPKSEYENKVTLQLQGHAVLEGVAATAGRVPIMKSSGC
jgi:hypothetical protein